MFCALPSIMSLRLAKLGMTSSGEYKCFVDGNKAVSVIIRQERIILVHLKDLKLATCHYFSTSQRECPVGQVAPITITLSIDQKSALLRLTCLIATHKRTPAVSCFAFNCIIIFLTSIPAIVNQYRHRYHHENQV